MTARFQTTTAPDRPEFIITVDGTEIDQVQARDVLEIDVDERVNGHAIAQILLRNWDAETRTPIYGNQELFAPGAELVVSAGYRSELTEIFAGQIMAMTTNFAPEGLSVISIEARSTSQRMAAAVRHRTFEELSVGDRFSAIANDYGLSAEVGEGDIVETLHDHATDWDRVLQVAAEWGWVGYVRDDQLVLQPPSAEPAEITLKYGTNLLELRLTEDLRRATSPIIAAGWDAEAQERLESEADANELDTGSRPPLADALAASGLAMADQQVTSPARLSQGTVDQRAAGTARNQQLRHLTGLGAAIGLPKLRCDAWMEIEGTGKLTDGPHYVSRVRHRIGGKGYTTEFTLGLPEPLVPPPLADPALAQARMASGLTIGVVTDLADPETAGRVKVVVPTAGPTVEAFWARLSTVDAGIGHGSVFVPSVGNEVVLGFIGGDAVVLGQLYSPAHQPPLKIDADENTIKGFVTAAGHTVLLDDAEPKISILTGGGHTLVMNDDSAAITITESSGNSITMDSSGIVLEAATGDLVLKAAAGTVKLEGAAIEGKASGPSKLESSATFDISASATLGLKGALVNIN